MQAREKGRVISTCSISDLCCKHSCFVQKLRCFRIASSSVQSFRPGASEQHAAASQEVSQVPALIQFTANGKPSFSVIEQLKIEVQSTQLPSNLLRKTQITSDPVCSVAHATRCPRILKIRETCYRLAKSREYRTTFCDLDMAYRDAPRGWGGED